MSLNYQEFSLVKQELIDGLKKLYPVSLSKKGMDDFDRGVAWGRQEIIDLLESIRSKQSKNKQ